MIIWEIIYGPDYGQPGFIHMCGQTMVSQESCYMYYDRVWSACLCMGGKSEISIFEILFIALNKSSKIFFLSYRNDFLTISGKVSKKPKFGITSLLIVRPTAFLKHFETVVLSRILK